MPVVGHHDGASSLSVTEFLSCKSSADNQQKGDKSAGHVKCVETSCDVKSAAIGVAADADSFRDQSRVLQNLTRHEEGTEHIANEEPLDQTPLGRGFSGSARLHPLSGEHPELRSKRRSNQDQGVDKGELDIKNLSVVGPDLRGVGTKAEIHGKQTGKKHYLAG